MTNKIKKKIGHHFSSKTRFRYLKKKDYFWPELRLIFYANIKKKIKYLA